MSERNKQSEAWVEPKDMEPGFPFNRDIFEQSKAKNQIVYKIIS